MESSTWKAAEGRAETSRATSATGLPSATVAVSIVKPTVAGGDKCMYIILYIRVHFEWKPC